MDYLEPKTLEFFIYLLYKNKPVNLNQFSPDKINIVVDDIIKNKIERFFVFNSNDQMQNSYLKTKLFFKIQGIKRRIEFGDTTKDYPKIIKIWMKVNDPIRTMEFQEFKEIESEIYPELYKFLSLNFFNSGKKNLLILLKEYINLFSNDQLKPKRLGENFYNFENNAIRIYNLFKYYSEKCAFHDNPAFSINPYNEVEKPFEKKFRLYDLILYLIFNEYISIIDCDFVEFIKEKYLCINIRLKKSLKEIFNNIKVENTKPSKISLVNSTLTQKDDEIVLELTYDFFSRNIFINKLPLITPRYDSPNRLVFEYLYKHPNEKISKETLDSEVKKEYEEGLGKKSLYKIAQELGFTKERKKLFLITTKNFAILRTRITKRELEESGIDISKVLQNK